MLTLKNMYHLGQLSKEEYLRFRKKALGLDVYKVVVGEKVNV